MRSVMAVLVCVVAMGCGGNVDPMCEPCDEPGDAVAFQLPDGCYPYCEAPPDSDGDEVPDASDACPNEPETVNGYQDSDGCPDARPEPAPISTEIAGTWAGATKLAVNGGAYVKPQIISIVVSADRYSGTVTGFCPDGSGSVPLAAYTTAPIASWSGVFSCPPGPWGVCADGRAIRANMIVFGVSARPTSSGVVVTSHGAVTLTDGDDTKPSPCDQTGEFNAEFTGTR